MARIRSVHPGLFTDEAFVAMQPLARLLLIGLWTEADDQGVFEWKPITMKMRLLPVDSVDVPALLAELSAANTIQAFDHGGKAYGAIRNFQRYQRPKKPNAVFPLPHAMTAFVGVREGVGSEPTGSDDDGSSEDPPHQRGGSSPPAPSERPHRGERADVQRGSGGEPRAVERGRVPPKREMAPQMEDGGGKREDGGGREVSPPAPRGEAERAPDPPGFAEFWEAYPRKTAKDDARKAWMKATKRAKPAEIMAGLARATFDQREFPRFVPHPTTWLNRGQWQDEGGAPPTDQLTGTARARAAAEAMGLFENGRTVDAEVGA